MCFIDGPSKESCNNLVDQTGISVSSFWNPTLLRRTSESDPDKYTGGLSISECSIVLKDDATVFLLTLE